MHSPTILNNSNNNHSNSNNSNNRSNSSNSNNNRSNSNNSNTNRSNSNNNRSNNSNNRDITADTVQRGLRVFRGVYGCLRGVKGLPPYAIYI